ncbi:SURF1 family protein [Actinomycetes bacterium KLBMP 9759]
MRFLLRPGWIALVAVVAGFVVACYTLLAPWQFGREAERESQQRAIDASFATPPVPLADLSAPGAGVAPDVAWRQVTVSGQYLPDAEALVRLRHLDNAPAYEVLTPLRTSDGRLLVVDRGLVAATGGAEVPAFAAAPSGPVTLTARLRTDETDPDGRPVFTAAGHRQLYAADSRTLAAATGLALEPGYLQLSDGQPGVLTALAVAPTASGAPFTNLSYALQWLTFGAIAVFALVYFVRLELMQRRGEGRATRKAAVRRALAGDDEG